MLFFDSKKVPHTSSEYLYKPSQKWKECRLIEKFNHRGRDGQSPGTSEEKICSDSNVVNCGIFIAEMVPQESVFRVGLKEAPIVFLYKRQNLPDPSNRNMRC